MANPQQNGFILQRTIASAVTESPLFFAAPAPRATPLFIP